MREKFECRSQLRLSAAITKAMSKPSAKMGRPTKYSEEWAEAFCKEIREGSSVAEITDRADQPSERCVHNWLNSNQEFFQLYARAREARADLLFKEIITMADAATPENVNVQRLKVDSRKFAVAKLSPRKYGDRVLTEQRQLGANGKPISPDFVVNILPYPDEPVPASKATAGPKDTRY